jgi:hypothetical protein
MKSTTRNVLVRALLACGLAACGQGAAPELGVKLAFKAGPDTVVYRRSVTRANQDSSAGTRTVVMRALRLADRVRLLEVEQRFPGGGGTIIDTAIAELPGLKAVAHRSHQPARTMRFDFAATAASGVVTNIPVSPDSATRIEAVHQDLGGRIYDSNIIELVVASLPLKAAFSTEVPFFIYERGGRVPMAVAVQDRATVEFPGLGVRREAWVVSVDVPGAPATVWVDTRTRAVLRTRYDVRARGVSFTDDRITPLPSS